ENLHRLLHRGRHPGGCSPAPGEPAGEREGQGLRRHPHPGGRGRLPGTGGGPAGRQRPGGGSPEGTGMNPAVQSLYDVHAPYGVVGILPGLFRLPIPLPRNPLRELNAYLIRGRDRSLLIDTGFRLPECRQALQEGLRAAGAERDPLDVFLTHIHTDHTGLASEVVRPGGILYMAEGDFPFTRQAYEDAYWVGIDQRFLREGFPVEELKATRGTNPARNLGPTLDLPNYRMVKDGEVLTVGDYTLQVIATPGHTP